MKNVYIKTNITINFDSQITKEHWPYSQQGRQKIPKP